MAQKIFRDTASTSLSITAWFLIVAVVAAFGTMAFRLIMAPAASAVGVVEKTMNSDNVIRNYEWFYDASGAINARRAQINAHRNLATAETDKSERQRLMVELTGQQQSCRDLVASYNANASKVNRSIFKTDSTPASFPVTYCE